MPSTGPISISLQSQYNGTRLSEYPATETLLQAPHRSQALDRPLEHCWSAAVNVFIETNSASQFWINYVCQPPPEYSATRYYYFKLFVSNKCLISWCTGAADHWRGRVMYGLFNGGTDFLGRHLVREKRALQFPKKGGNEGLFEIKVYRSNVRRREKPRYQGPRGTVPGAGHVVTSKIGEVKRNQPQRMYSFALLDPIDKPFATVRYHHRSYEQLNQLGVLDDKEELMRKNARSAPRSPTKDFLPTDSEMSETAYKTSANPPPLPEGTGTVSSPLKTRSRSDVHKMPVIDEEKRLSWFG